MKLTETQIVQTANQIGAQPIPDEGELAPKLVRLFGEHTFFLDSSGLHIVAPTDPTETGMPAGRIVTIAGWTDSHCTTLAPQEPEFTDIVVELKAA